MSDRPSTPKRVSTKPPVRTTASTPVRRSVAPTPAPSGSFTAPPKPPTKNGSKSNGGNGDQPRWKRVTKRTAIGVLIGGTAVLVLGFLALAISYARIQVPDADDFAQAQSSTIYYADGETVMGRLGVADRKLVNIEDLPEYVPNALVASEDRSFYTNPGVDIKGTARALFKTVVLGQQQGGSTITQQYVERYYVGETTTDIPGKVKEALLALKIDNQQEKSEVLQNYMNTIYYGRGAYGIEAAARQYFGTSAANLTYSQAALLAGIVPAPSAWDPRLDPDKAEERWNYVLDGMVLGGYITEAERTAAVFPETIEYQNADVYGGPTGYILRTALNEVESSTGITQEEIESQGYSVVTTIDQEAQAATEAAVAEMPDDHADNLRVGAVTMDAPTGAILSMYGGADYLEIQRNAVTQDIAQAGSTFKPFALIASLEAGNSLKSTYKGNNRMRINGFDEPVRNFNGRSFGTIDLVKATANSVNTVYAQLGQDVGPAAVRDVAIRAGLPEDTLGLEDNAANVLGTASPHVLDMAKAYATLANQGKRVDPYIVAKVIDAEGNVIYEHETEQETVFAADVMADTTYAMQQVVRDGSGSYARELGRPIAGKTGTSNDNRSAWFVGFTPQVVGAVALYQVGEDGSAEEITTFGDFEQITGGTIPVRIFTWMMGPILEKYEVVDFPSRANVGTSNVPPKTTPSPTPTPSETVDEPEPEPSVTPSEEPTIVPTPDPTLVPEAP